MAGGACGDGDCTERALDFERVVMILAEDGVIVIDFEFRRAGHVLVVAGGGSADSFSSSRIESGCVFHHRTLSEVGISVYLAMSMAEAAALP